MQELPKGEGNDVGGQRDGGLTSLPFSEMIVGGLFRHHHHHRVGGTVLASAATGLIGSAAAG